MKYQINIPEPCKEKWSHMSVSERGAFCSHCQKEVIDFTNMSDPELAAIFSREKNICGKFKPEQLNRDLPVLTSNKTTQTSFLLSLTALLSFFTPAFSQVKTKESIEITLRDNKVLEDKQLDKNLDSVEIRGKVEGDGYPLPGLHVEIENYTYAATTDFD